MKIIDIIGNTPLVEIHGFHQNKEVKLYAKLEGQNPGGSVKDRPAHYMVKLALERGDITKDTKLIEATSGNTGIALAMIAGQYKLPIEIALPKNSTKERIVAMEAYGAQITLLDSMEACRDYAEEKGRQEGYYIFNQFANPDNYRSHYETTAPEIWKDTDGQITHFVSAMGTTGTIMGCSRFFKEKNEKIQIIGCQPQDGSSIPGIRKWPVEYLPKIYEKERIDKIIELSEADARSAAKKMAKDCGIFAGMSSGGAFHAAVQVANSIEKGTVVFIICDRGDRYSSSDLFD